MAKRGKNIREVLKAVNIKAEEVLKQIREEIDNFRPVIEKDIDRVIAKNKDLFNIRSAGGDELVAELGVGDGGAANEFKINNAWEALKLGFDAGNKASPVSLNFFKDKRRIGGQTTMTYRIRDSFYNLNLTNVVNEGKAGGTIPWMKWFIEGATTTGYSVKFLSEQRNDSSPITAGLENFGRTIRNRSRTGEALMFKSKNGPFWTINPRPHIWIKIKTEIAIQMEKSSVKFLKAIAKKFKT